MCDSSVGTGKETEEIRGAEWLSYFPLFPPALYARQALRKKKTEKLDDDGDDDWMGFLFVLGIRNLWIPGDVDSCIRRDGYRK